MIQLAKIIEISTIFLNEILIYIKIDVSLTCISY